MERKYRLEASGYDFEKVIHRVADVFQMNPSEVLLPGKEPYRVKARSLLCFWSVKVLGISSLEVAVKLGITQSAVSRAVQRGERLALERNLLLENQ